jgi:hypothetical protein
MRREMRPVYDVLTAFGFYRLGPTRASRTRQKGRTREAQPPSLVNDADVDDVVDTADVSLPRR